MNHAPDVPKDRFYAMTMLDENRARALLAQKAGVPVADICDMAIWGNHSTTQYPDFYHAKIAGKPATEVITDLNWLQNDFIPQVQKRGAAVLKARGASSAASAANGVIDGVYNLTHDTRPNDCFSMAKASQGEYGVDGGLIFSFPCRTENGQLKVIGDISHNAFGQEKMQATLDELRAERDAVKDLGLID
jgi:malate dehydrogenase